MNGTDEFTVVPRFQNKIKSSLLYRFYSEFNIAIGGNHYHTDKRIEVQNPAQPVQAFVSGIHAGCKIHIKQYNIHMVFSQSRYQAVGIFKRNNTVKL